MIDFSIFLGMELTNLFKKDIEKCVSSFGIKLEGLNKTKLKKKIRELNSKNCLSFNSLKEDETSFIHKEGVLFTIYYNSNLFEKNSYDWKFMIAHELAHYLFWNVQRYENYVDLDALPTPPGLDKKIKACYSHAQDVRDNMVICENNWILPYDIEILADTFAMAFILTRVVEYIWDEEKCESVTVNVDTHEEEELANLDIVERVMDKRPLKMMKLKNRILNLNKRFKPTLHKIRDYEILKFSISKLIENAEDKEKLFFQTDLYKIYSHVDIKWLRNIIKKLENDGYIYRLKKGTTYILKINRESEENGIE
jgi:hypothetical protein